MQTLSFIFIFFSFFCLWLIAYWSWLRRLRANRAVLFAIVLLYILNHSINLHCLYIFVAHLFTNIVAACCCTFIINISENLAVLSAVIRALKHIEANGKISCTKTQTNYERSACLLIWVFSDKCQRCATWNMGPPENADCPRKPNPNPNPRSADPHFFAFRKMLV